MREALLSSLRDRAVNHKFHYASYKQARQWRALFTRYSPFINDPGCALMYGQSYLEAAQRTSATSVHVIGLGCGSGEKDLRLLSSLHDAGRTPRYTPVDVSMPLVVMAHGQAEQAGVDVSDGIVCDILAAGSLSEITSMQKSQKLIAFFGMIPNFEPKAILPQIAALLDAGDRLLLSANLAAGADYEAGVRKVLPQYDNPETEAWLLSFLKDLGITHEEGRLTWAMENDLHYPALRRLSAWFRFTRHQSIEAEQEKFSFAPGEQLRLFFSYRYTVELLQTVLADHGLRTRQTWVSGEEAVLLCERH